METKEKDAKETKPKKKRTYRTRCCVINCNNQLGSAIDPRTKEKARFHGFPADQNLRKRWLINIRRKDLTLKTIGTKKVCSCHFETIAYNCPSDIYYSSLLPSAAPTIVDCPNPPKLLQGKRKPPTVRPFNPPVKKLKRAKKKETELPPDSDAPTEQESAELNTDNKPQADTRPYPVSLVFSGALSNSIEMNATPSAALEVTSPLAEKKTVIPTELDVKNQSNSTSSLNDSRQPNGSTLVQDMPLPELDALINQQPFRNFLLNTLPRLNKNTGTSTFWIAVPTQGGNFKNVCVKLQRSTENRSMGGMKTKKEPSMTQGFETQSFVEGLNLKTEMKTKAIMADASEHKIRDEVTRDMQPKTEKIEASSSFPLTESENNDKGSQCISVETMVKEEEKFSYSDALLTISKTEPLSDRDLHHDRISSPFLPSLNSVEKGGQAESCPQGELPAKACEGDDSMSKEAALGPSIMGEAECPVVPQFEPIQRDEWRAQLTTHEATPAKENLHACKSLSTKSALKQHMQAHTGVKPHKCNLCEKSFALKYQLGRHLRRHTGEKRYICTVCGKSFSTAGYLKVHWRAHTDEKPNQCEVCGKSLSTKSALKQHMQAHTGLKPHKCNLCEKSFALKYQLGHHLRRHTGEKRYICTVCGKSFCTSGQLKVHWRTHTGEKPYQCEVCGKSFAQLAHRITHSRTHTGEKPFTCRVCGKTYSDSRSYKKHFLTHPSQSGQSPSQSGRSLCQFEQPLPYQCEVCGSAFHEKSYLEAHMRKHNGERPYQCDLCSESFCSKHGLNVHNGRCHSHTRQMPHQCSKCGKSFHSQSSLKVHLRRHTGVKPHECQVCKKSFFDKASLGAHMRSHTGEKPYQCKICKKSFANKQGLDIHVLRHTGVKPHDCKVCGRSFFLKFTLELHMRTHTGEKPLQCQVCGRSFAQSSTLKSHLRRHNGEKPYQCEVCGMSYSSSSSLRKHVCH